MTLENRISDQLSLIKRRLRDHQRIDDYYWTRRRPARYGIAAVPHVGRSVLAQLLHTPKLIVDILPLTVARFVDYYGVHPMQMVKLAEEGFLIPNIYHYKGDGWRNYLPHADITKLLAEHGRPNTEWITRYLNSKYNFNSVEDGFVEFFKKTVVPENQKNSVLEAFRGRVKDWDVFPAVAGQRLAYIEVLGGPNANELVRRIRRYYVNPGERIRALRLLNGSKYFLATETTAAYGGYVTDTDEQITDFRSTVRDLVVVEKTNQESFESMRNRRRLPAAAVEFIREVAVRAGKVKIPPFATVRTNPTTNLTKAQFKRYLAVLRKVRDGQLGRLAEELTNVLLDPTSALEPTLDEYRDLVRELDDDLKTLPSVAAGLRRIGTYLSESVFEFPTTSGSFESILLFGGVQAHLLAGWLEEVEMIPWFRGRRSRQLYGTWRGVKRALEIRRSSGN